MPDRLFRCAAKPSGMTRTARVKMKVWQAFSLPGPLSTSLGFAVIPEKSWSNAE
jgi:hypothetical protein